MLGFLITGAAAIVLVRFEGVREVEEEDTIDGLRDHPEPPGRSASEFVSKRDGE